MMKIKLTKKRGSISLKFRAETYTEGIDLKEIVLASAKESRINNLIDGFKARGYTGTISKETRNTKEFTLSAPGASTAAAIGDEPSTASNLKV